jgi:2-polyprenyl-6-methoxyphenol hydroxylase-like FAD-dependent oxidoreductase
MKVVISGSGIAGLAAACYLRMLPTISQITIIESGQSKNFFAEKKFTGLWNPAIKCIEEICSSSICKGLIHEGTFIKGSGYREWKKGDWIIRPSVGLNSYVSGTNTPALGFFTNGDILTALHDSLSRKVTAAGQTAAPVHIHYNSTLTGLSAGHVYSTTETFACDFLVAADGAHSSVYTLLHGGPDKASSRLEYR